jgi:hypothetical protein
VLSSIQVRTIAAVVSAVGLTICLILLPLPGIWRHVFRWAFYLPIFLTGASYGPFAGSVGGLAASLLWAFVAVSRGTDDASWPAVLAPDLVLVGLLGGLLRAQPRTQKSYSGRWTDTWPGLGRISEPDPSFDLNPLSSIESAVGLLAQDETPAALRRELVAIVLTECEHLSGSIKGLVERCRAAPAQDQLADFPAIVDAAVQEAKFFLGPQGVTLRKEIALGIPSIQCSPDQIRNLLVSLAINAADASLAGSEVVLNARGADDGVILEVRNQGQWSFVRWTLNYLRSRPGTSDASLAAAYEIVRQCSGKISRIRNIRKGVEFSVWLPLYRNRTYGPWQGAGRRG